MTHPSVISYHSLDSTKGGIISPMARLSRTWWLPYALLFGLTGRPEPGAWIFGGASPDLAPPSAVLMHPDRGAPAYARGRVRWWGGFVWTDWCQVATSLKARPILRKMWFPRWLRNTITIGYFWKGFKVPSSWCFDDLLYDDLREMFALRLIWIINYYYMFLRIVRDWETLLASKSKDAGDTLERNHIYVTHIYTTLFALLTYNTVNVNMFRKC